MAKKRPLPIGNTGLRRTRGGYSKNAPAPGTGAAPANDADAAQYLNRLKCVLDDVAKQPVKPVNRSLLSPILPDL